MCRDYGNGISLVWLPVNQAYAVMWFDQVLRIFNEYAEAHAEALWLTSKAS